MPSLFVDLAIPVAVDKIFTYSVPESLQPLVKRGICVAAPFGSRTVMGIVVHISRRSAVHRTKNIYDILDAEPLLSDELLRLGSWISEYYLCPLGEVVK